MMNYKEKAVAPVTNASALARGLTPLALLVGLAVIGLSSAVHTESQISPLDCDSLEDDWRVETDTISILPVFGMPGDTVDIEFYVKNDSFLAGFSFLYYFDTSLLEPALIYDTIIDCSPLPCDTTVALYIRTFQNSRAHQGGILALGPYELAFANIGRIAAVPFTPEIDSVVPGADVLCYQKFVVKETATEGCFGTFEFITFPVWSVDTTVFPPDSTFITCRFNEMAQIYEDFPVVVIATQTTGIFRVGTTSAIACGDANGNGVYNVADAVYIINSVFAGGQPPCPTPGLGDVNCNGSVNVADAILIINNVFSGGPSPCCPDGI